MKSGGTRLGLMDVVKGSASHSNRELQRTAEVGVRAVRGSFGRPPCQPQCRGGESSMQEVKEAAVGLAGVTAARVVEGPRGNRTWRQPTRGSGGGRLRHEVLAAGFCSRDRGRGALLSVRALRRARVLQGVRCPGGIFGWLCKKHSDVRVRGSGKQSGLGMKFGSSLRINNSDGPCRSY